MHREDLKVVCVQSQDEVLVRADNFVVGMAAYETAIRLLPKSRIQYRHGARIIAQSDES
jgi:hypothetical protein